MRCKTFAVLGGLLLIACATNSHHAPAFTMAQPLIHESSNPFTSIDKIPLPPGFERMPTAANSFGEWLQKVSLKKDKTVYLFNGQPKKSQLAQIAVLDISVGNKDLQQCADAVMRLRAEYLFSIQQYASIHFTDNEGKSYQFTAPYTHGHLLQYLERVFGMCGSASLAKQLHAKPFQHMQVGDVLIRGGFPGHAVIVMDMASNTAGEKIFLLAQGYMPAQDMHVLKNPLDPNSSPWYQLHQDRLIPTPEYLFTNDELKSW